MNHNKCAFGVSAGQFLGFMVHQRGIEISRRSIDAIGKVVAPTNKTELQSLIGKINFVRQFISNLLGKIRAFSPFLKLKANQEFVWGKSRIIWQILQSWFHLSMEGPSDYIYLPIMRSSVYLSFKNLKGKSM